MSIYTGFLSYGTICQEILLKDKGTGLKEVIKICLENQPDIKIRKQQVEQFKGIYRQTDGIFEPSINLSVGNSRDNLPAFLDNIITPTEKKYSTYSVDILKQFSWGMSLQPSLQFTREIAKFQGIESYSYNFSTVNLDLRFPLLRGFMGNNLRSYLRGAESQVSAAELDLIFSYSKAIYNSISAYWNYLLSIKRIDLSKKSYLRMERIHNEIKKIVEEREKPAADLRQIEANLLDKKIQLINSEQNLIESINNFGIALGLSIDNFKKIGDPLDPFPAPEIESDSINLSESEFYIQYALSSRADLLSLRKKIESQSEILNGRENEMLSDLSLNLNMGFYGYDFGKDFNQYFSSITKNRTDLNIGAKLVYTIPIPNDKAGGKFVEEKSIYNQMLILLNETERTIKADIESALSNIKNVVIELRAAKKSADLYSLSQQNEITKIRLGSSTIMNVLYIEDLLTAAEGKLVLAQYKYAMSILYLRFITGTLTENKKDLGYYNVNLLKSFPRKENVYNDK